MPELIVFAGPNGSGKSSISRAFLRGKTDRFLNPDDIAKRINPDAPDRAAIAAAREVLRRANEYIAARESFQIETTLAGNWTHDAVAAAMQASFVVRFVYVCLEDPDRCATRVEERVARGGHDVPDGDIRRRYWRSLENAKELLPIIHEARVFDNSGIEPRKIFEMRMGRVVWISDDIPDWAVPLIPA